MRIEPHTVGSYLHLIKRGARGMPIAADQCERERFLKLIYHMNDDFLDINWEQSLHSQKPFERPDAWPERKPLVAVLAFTLMPNHFHIIVREARDGGASAFMRRVGQSMTLYFNNKHQQRGSLFQGAYKSRTIGDDDYFRYVLAYVLVKNTFELFPDNGLDGAKRRFDSAWKWALTYPFSSLGWYVRGEPHPIVDAREMDRILPPAREFKPFARDVIQGGNWSDYE